MGRNNQRRKTNIEQRNFKLYKHKKQWMTACATFLLTFGATAVMNVSASANTDNISNGNSTPKNAEVVKATLTNEEQSNNAQPVNEMPADSKKQAATASTADQSTAKQTTAVKDRQEQTVATQPTESVNSSKDTNHSATVATSPVSSAIHPTSSADTAQSNGEQSESTVVTSQTTSGKTAETNQADNKNAETTIPKSSSTASQKAKPVTPHADSTENVTPNPYTIDGEEPPYVIAGSNLTDLASKFLQNGNALLQSGAKISWVGGCANSNSTGRRFNDNRNH
ncbi:KxYKxGKxW signal peptide domain-containing protein [Limosilactobacillus portuensis]|uniref:KxYKxGKxW signal peptide domain-containing protein n=1 Tax=Limosilactobacillus portuensis TaxID=2742601 RepID=UPI003D74BCB3